MILSHIVAASKNGVIGGNNKLPWNIPEDLKFFKDKTKGRILIMGRKTFESLPGVLPNRLHIVISRLPQQHENPNVIFVKDIYGAVKFASENTQKWGDEVFIAGGGEIYRQTMGLADRIYLTRIDQDFDGDAHYPEVSKQDFKLVEQKDSQLGDLKYSFLTFEKTNKK